MVSDAPMSPCYAGANVQKGRFLETPLHVAAQKDCPEIVKELLEYGANINSRNLELKRPVEAAPASSLAEGLLLLCEGMLRPRPPNSPWPHHDIELFW